MAQGEHNEKECSLFFLLLSRSLSSQLPAAKLGFFLEFPFSLVAFIFEGKAF